MEFLVQTEQKLAVEISGNYQHLLEQQRAHEVSYAGRFWGCETVFDLWKRLYDALWRVQALYLVLSLLGCRHCFAFFLKCEIFLS